MRADYIRHILDSYMAGWGVAYPTMKGILVDTPFIRKVTDILRNLPYHQFLVSDTMIVTLNKESITVCKACGSPHFNIKTMEESSAYIDPKQLKARTIKLRSRSTVVECSHCGELNKIKVYRHPEVY